MTKWNMILQSEIFSLLSMLYTEKMHITLSPKQEAVEAITYIWSIHIILTYTRLSSNNLITCIEKQKFRVSTISTRRSYIIAIRFIIPLTSSSSIFLFLDNFP